MHPVRRNLGELALLCGRGFRRILQQNCVQGSHLSRPFGGIFES